MRPSAPAKSPGLTYSRLAGAIRELGFEEHREELLLRFERSGSYPSSCRDVAELVGDFAAHRFMRSIGRLEEPCIIDALPDHFAYPGDVIIEGHGVARSLVALGAVSSTCSLSLDDSLIASGLTAGILRVGGLISVERNLDVARIIAIDAQIFADSIQCERLQASEILAQTLVAERVDVRRIWLDQLRAKYVVVHEHATIESHLECADLDAKDLFLGAADLEVRTLSVERVSLMRGALPRASIGRVDKDVMRVFSTSIDDISPFALDDGPGRRDFRKPAAPPEPLEFLAGS